METTHEKIDTWAVVEQLGHNRFAGKITEQEVAGVKMLRIDVPERPARAEQREPQHGWVTQHARPGVPAYTKFLGASTIFAITPCSEDVARAALEELQIDPVTTLSRPTGPALLAAPDEDDEDEEDDDDDEF